jgi:hypothetical protein
MHAARVYVVLVRSRAIGQASTRLVSFVAFFFFLVPLLISLTVGIPCT